MARDTMTDIDTWRRRGEAARLAHQAVNRAFREHLHQRDPDRYDALLREFRMKTAAALPSSIPAFVSGLAGFWRQQLRSSKLIPGSFDQAMRSKILYVT
jgi:hypothetical protein